MLIESGDTEKGLEVLNEAVTAESNLPVDFGPPTIVKPSYELLGDVLSDLGRYDEAMEAYEKQLERTPDRRLSLIGKDRISGMASR
jgi:tetratricopeptide (TPR) repeat protein